MASVDRPFCAFKNTSAPLFAFPACRPLWQSLAPKGPLVMAGACPGHPRLLARPKQDVDARDKLAHDRCKYPTERLMIEVYYWTTPNGHKITMFLEEAGLEYKIVPVNIGKGEQFKPDFLAVSPNNRIPAILDRKPKGGGAPIPVFESGAILLYLADKTGKFLPSDLRTRYDATQWL